MLLVELEDEQGRLSLSLFPISNFELNQNRGQNQKLTRLRKRVKLKKDDSDLIFQKSYDQLKNEKKCHSMK